MQTPRHVGYSILTVRAKLRTHRTGFARVARDGKNLSERVLRSGTDFRPRERYAQVHTDFRPPVMPLVQIFGLRYENLFCPASVLYETDATEYVCGNFAVITPSLFTPSLLPD